uniref:TIR domain-containing protein n=1 Tax=Caenorhabditis tropicalis TaxID=1561998 RepID=A0A1I7TNU1_9PELO
MFKAYLMAEEQNEQVRDILLLPTTVNDQVGQSEDQVVASVVDFFHGKLAEYNEIIAQNSRSVFVANYVQNRFLVTEFCPELAKLFDVLKVKSLEELVQKLNGWMEDPAMKASGKALLESFDAWDNFLREIDDELEKALGPVKSQVVTLPEDSGILGLQSKTISYYVTGSAFDCVLIIVVRAFNKPEVNDHILGLYNRIDELRKLRCDVFLLTKGPPIGSSGGAYIKLIGVPFRKLYDMNEAEEQLKVNRKSALEHNGWHTLCKVVEASLAEGDSVSTAPKESPSEDSVAYISQKGGTVLVDKSGEILYKHIEDDKTDSWPDIDEIVRLVEARNAKYLSATNNNSTTSIPKGGNLAKVNSEISVTKEVATDKKKPCCVIS